MVDAIPTQVHGVVMAIKGFPVHHSEHSTNYHLMRSAPPQVIPEKLTSYVTLQKRTLEHIMDNPG